MTPATDDTLPLAGRVAGVRGTGVASRYAAALLAHLGAQPRTLGQTEDEHPALAWARSGLMALTGARDAPPQMLVAPLAACAEGVVLALAALDAPLPESFASGAALLGERAAMLGLQRNGAVSAGGSCRLLRCRDGMLAVNLARPEDWASVAAWLDGDAASDWDGLAHALRHHGRDPAIERARLLGLPVAAAALPVAGPPPGTWCSVRRCAARLERRGRQRPLVVDLSSLWAGPLCAQLLQQLGARVIKVESIRRPDGARSDARPGAAAFFDRLNAGKASVALDFGNAADVARLRRLLQRADIVIESARPRALRQLGIDAAQLLAANPGLSWVGLSGYGREEPAANWVAFGDDAGVAGGLSALLAASSGAGWSFCADAIADPLTGLHAALAAWSAWRGGGGVLVDVALQRVVAHCAGFELPRRPEALAARWRRWSGMAWSAGLAELRPSAPPPSAAACALGADSAAVLDELAA
ncbi:MAG TPA: CoA transferase [Rubrivivax sp.]|nr:CoA transferase [Rubrivivax sp.]HPO18049.1 CoA transferase [Rubrivivax sp.]